MATVKDVLDISRDVGAILECVHMMRARGVASRDSLFVKLADSMLAQLNLTAGTNLAFDPDGNIVDHVPPQGGVTTKEAKQDGSPY